MKKRLSVLFLALAMLMTLMAGCSSKPESSTTPESVPASTPAEETKAPETPEASETSEASTAEETSQAESLVEETAEMPADYVLPINETPVELDIFYPVRSGTHPSKTDERAVFWHRLQERLGYTIHWTEPYQSTASEQFNLVIAAGDFPHIVFESLIAMTGSAYTGGYDLAVDEDVYMDLTPYLEEYAPHYNYLLQDPGIYNDIVTEQGRIVPFATINSEPAKTGMGAVVNKEYWEATGLELPTTVEELHEVDLAMKNNGVESPLNVSAEGSIVEGIVAQAMGASFEGTPILDNATGELILDVTTDEARAYIELFRQWFQEGILDTDFASISEMDFTPFNNGTVGTCSGMGFMLDSYYDTYGVYQQPLPILHGDGLEEKEVLLKTWPTSLVNSMPGIALTTACEADDLVEPCMRLCDFFYSDAGYLACNYGWEEGETYNVVDGKPVPNDFFNERDPDLQVANKSLYTSDSDFGYVYPNFNFDIGSETMMEAAELWTLPEDQPKALYTTLPGNMKLNAEETAQVATHLTDLQTYVESTVLLWMTGQTELTDSSWQEFVDKCDSMKLDDILEVYTGAYERYIGQ